MAGICESSLAILIKEQRDECQYLLPGAAPGRGSLVLTAMIFAVAMTFIDQTIVSIAAPTIQHDLGLSSSGMQWAINAYLLTLAAFSLRRARWPTSSGTGRWWCSG